MPRRERRGGRLRRGAKQGRNGYYGLYHGGTVVNGCWRSMILIYRDTLVRDFGQGPEWLRRNGAITVRHEVAHHLGASERRVAEDGVVESRFPALPADRPARGRSLPASSIDGRCRTTSPPRSTT